MLNLLSSILLDVSSIKHLVLMLPLLPIEELERRFPFSTIQPIFELVCATAHFETLLPPLKLTCLRMVVIKVVEGKGVVG